LEEPQILLKQVIDRCDRSNLAEMLKAVEGVVDAFPSFTAGRIKMHALAAQLGKRSDSFPTDAIQQFIVTENAFPSVPVRHLNTVVKDVSVRALWSSPGSRMPIIRGVKTENLHRKRYRSARALSSLFEECFAQYLFARPSLFKAVRDAKGVDIRVWGIKLLPGGSIGAHYHPQGFISAVYYPPLFPGSGLAGGDIEFGVFPREIGPVRAQPKYRISPASESVLVFPSFMGHRVTRTKGGSCERFSFSADFRLIGVPRENRNEGEVLNAT
jgi:hypothetical protein